LNPGQFRWFYLYFCSFGELHLLLSWCVGGRCSMVSSDEDRDRSRRPGVEDWGCESCLEGGE
jgi:hypothetical protein